MFKFLYDLQQFINELFYLSDEKNFKRTRKFNSESLFQLVLEFSLSKNLDYKTLGLESDINFAASSFGAARGKLDPFVFQEVSQWIYRFIHEKEESSKKWYGRDLYAVDGCTIMVSRELEKDGFRPSEMDNPHPNAYLNCLYDIKLGMPYYTSVHQYKNERENAINSLDCLSKEAVVIGDRGYFSFEMHKEIERRDLKYIFRVSKDNVPSELREFFEDDRLSDEIACCPSEPTQKKLNNRGLCNKPIFVKAYKYFVGDSKYVVITNLMEDEFESSDFQYLYKKRWVIEEHFKYLKTSLSLEKFRSKSLHGVLQEIYAKEFMSVISKALCYLSEPIKQSQRINLTGISRIIVSNLSIMFEKLFVKKLKRAIQIYKEKIRPDRSYPRISLKPKNKWIPV